MSGKRIISCLALAIREPGELLMIRRKGSGRWTLPGGRLKPQESWRHCALRETREETGISLDSADADRELVLHWRDRGGVRIYYFAQWHKYQGEAGNCEPHLHSEVAWLPLEALPDDILPALKAGIDGVLRGGGVQEAGFGPDGKLQRRKASDLTDGQLGWRKRLFNYLFPPIK